VVSDVRSAQTVQKDEWGLHRASRIFRVSAAGKLGKFNSVHSYKRSRSTTRSHCPIAISQVAEQRKQYKLSLDNNCSAITQERISLLNDLDFAWNAQDAAWDRQMNDLREFRKEMGHCNVPMDHHKYPKLGLWIKEQRRHYTLMAHGKPSRLTSERINALTSIGLCSGTHKTSFEKRLAELANFKKDNGNCNVQINCAANRKLATWIHHQRRQYELFTEGQPCNITDDRIRALDALGFDWRPRDKKQSSSDQLHDVSVSSDGSSASASDSDSGEEIAVLDVRPSKRQRCESAVE
jgi:Helicase associated domain